MGKVRSGVEKGRSVAVVVDADGGAAEEGVFGSVLGFLFMSSSGFFWGVSRADAESFVVGGVVVGVATSLGGLIACVFVCSC